LLRVEQSTRWWCRSIPLSPAVFASASWDPAPSLVKGFLAIGSRTTSQKLRILVAAMGVFANRPWLLVENSRDE